MSISEKCLTRRAQCATSARFFSAIFHLLVKGNTTIKLQVDLAFYQMIKLHVRGHRTEYVLFRDGIVDKRSLLNISIPSQNKPS